jgi:hypothetical protein
MTKGDYLQADAPKALGILRERRDETIMLPRCSNALATLRVTNTNRAKPVRRSTDILKKLLGPDHYHP